MKRNGIDDLRKAEKLILIAKEIDPELADTLIYWDMFIHIKIDLARQKKNL